MGLSRREAEAAEGVSGRAVDGAEKAAAGGVEAMFET